MRKFFEAAADRFAEATFTSGAAAAMFLIGTLYGAGELSQINMWGPRWWRHHVSDFGFPAVFSFYMVLVCRTRHAPALTAGYAFFLTCEVLQNFGSGPPGFDWTDIFSASLSTLLITILIRREETERLRTP